MVSIGLVLCTCGTPRDRDDPKPNVMVLKNYGELYCKIITTITLEGEWILCSAGKYILLFFSLPVFVYVCV